MYWCFACTHVCAPCTCSALRSQKRALAAGIIVTYGCEPLPCWVLRIQCKSSIRTASALNHRANHISSLQIAGFNFFQVFLSPLKVLMCVPLLAIVPRSFEVVHSYLFLYFFKFNFCHPSSWFLRYFTYTDTVNCRLNVLLVSPPQLVPVFFFFFLLLFLLPYIVRTFPCHLTWQYFEYKPTLIPKP